MANVGDSIKERFSSLGIATQDPFYMYVVVGALLILIIVLIALGVMMSELQTTALFPPTQNACPDYWDLSSNGQCVYPTESNAKNTGSNIISQYTDPNSNSKYIGINSPGFAGITGWGQKLNVSDGMNKYRGDSVIQQKYKFVSLSDPSGVAGLKELYPGLSTRCAQRKWAINNDLVWDGVTNFNGC